MNPSVLLIEDDITLGEILERKLSSEGYTTTLVTDGSVGLAKIKELKPDIVLLDILLPTLNGYEVLEAKKNDMEIKDIPVIIISNSGQPVELQRALELGARDYFIKAQLDPDDIFSKVKAIVPLTTSTSGQPFTNKKILLVEDDSFLSDILSKKLINEKCTVFHAASGESALGIIETNSPDIVLLDLVLPGMSGFSILEKIKSNPKSSNTPIIILSNLSLPADLDRAQALGANMFLVKSDNTPSEIFNAIKSILI